MCLHLKYPWKDTAQLKRQHGYEQSGAGTRAGRAPQPAPRSGVQRGRRAGRAAAESPSCILSFRMLENKQNAFLDFLL